MGDKIRQKAKITDQQLQTAWGKYLDKLGPEANESNRQLVSRTYDEASNLLPDNSITFDTKKIVESVKNAKNKIDTLSAAGEEATVLKTLEDIEKNISLPTKLTDSSGNIIPPTPIPTKLSTLIGTKKSLGKKNNMGPKRR